MSEESRKPYITIKGFIETLIFALLFVFSDQTNAQDLEQSLMTIEEYLEELKSVESEEGNLFCPNQDGEKWFKYNNCKEFMTLRQQGCYGNSTYDMKVEYRHKNACEEIEAVKQASTVNTNYFILNSKDWWQSLPAEIIPMKGGIYSDKSWARGKIELDKLVSGKLLGDLNYKNESVNNDMVKFILGTRIFESCGEINDILLFHPVLLADFDEDGIAELLLKGYRADMSESCPLGSGNSLGADFSALLKKANATERATILPYPK